jgi:hypothetical protein
MGEDEEMDGTIDAEPDGGMRTAEAQRQVEAHGGPREVPVEQRRREQQAQDGRPVAVPAEEVQSATPGQGADPDLATKDES